MQAAVRAGKRSWQRFPYYEWRYSGRGERFTRSDSAWLASLASLDSAIVEYSVAWLGRVLASRGVPRMLLELHLAVLYDELVKAVPARANIYATLLAASQTLREARLRHIDGATFVALTHAFAKEVDKEWNRRLPETGALLAAAVADERAGIALAVASVEGWMKDPFRFPRRWINAVDRALARARACDASALRAPSRR